MNIEVLKQAMEALEYFDKIATTINDIQIARPVVFHLRQAIKELESQEPVAWRTFDGEGLYFYCSYEDNETYADVWNKRNPNHKGWVERLYKDPKPCPTCEALARTVMLDQTSHDTTPPPVAEPHKQEPVVFKIYKPTPPRGAIPNVRDAELPWVYDQDPSSGNVASMWVTPVQTLRSKS
jgi:hypothetical protein